MCVAEEVVDKVEEMSKALQAKWMTIEHNVHAIQKNMKDIDTDLDTLENVYLAIEEYEILFSGSLNSTIPNEGMVLRFISEKLKTTIDKISKEYKEAEKSFHSILESGHQDSPITAHRLNNVNLQ
jgi:predicted phage-related endonuclease